MIVLITSVPVPQRLGIAPGVVHGIVGVLGDAILLPLGGFMHVLDETSVKIANPAAGKPERVCAG